MNSNKCLSKIPSELHAVPWLQTIVVLVQEQSEEIVSLKKTVQELKDEITRLTKTPKRPKFRPGGGNPKARSGAPGNNTGRINSTTARGMVPQKVQQEVRIVAAGIPKGSRFKGYQTYVVQELETVPKDITCKLEVWQSPDGSIVRASLPPEVQGSHFGHQLRALAHNLYALGMTEPGFFDLLRGTGIEISEGQVHNILINESDAYHQESEKILTAGLKEAPYIRTDDTGEKHQHKNVYCTHIGGEYFAYYTTASSKSRKNFLRILLQGKEGYAINEAFIWHLFQCGVKDDWLNRLEEHMGKKYQKKKGLNQLLNSLRIEGKQLRQQCIEAGLVGFISLEACW